MRDNHTMSQANTDHSVEMEQNHFYHNGLENSYQKLKQTKNLFNCAAKLDI